MVRSVIEEGPSKAAAADRFNTTAKTVLKLVSQFSLRFSPALRGAFLLLRFQPSSARLPSLRSRLDTANVVLNVERSCHRAAAVT
jgi:hypothetical protein